MVRERSQVGLQDCWNVEAIFPNIDVWQETFDQINPETRPRWPQIADLKGQLNEPTLVEAVLRLYFANERMLSLLYTYAHLRFDEDISNDVHKTAFSKISSLLNDFTEETSWIEPELLSLKEKEFSLLLKDPELKEYRFYLEKMARLREHTLSSEQEELLAQSLKPLQAAQKAFGAINDADFKFESAVDGKGQIRELTHGSYGVFIRSHDRPLRASAFKNLHGKYLAYENTLCELINGQVQSHVFQAKAKKYPSSLHAALYPKNIDTSVYHALIKAVTEEIDALHSYIQLRQKIMKVDTLHLHDMYVPLTGDIDIKIPYNEAEELIIESVAPLGSEYQNLLKEGLKNERWVDRYENLNKRSGAYSSGSFDTMPYILMNYKEQIKDLFTLAHEAGHSMHSLLTHKHQPYQYGNYPIFLAEVASTFNEELLMHLMLERARTNEERIYLINQKIEDIRGTLFRQTMFAEFELMIHDFAEKDIPLTPKLLKEEYRNLNIKYFGPKVCISKEAEAEWARIPHFYYNFYVYQYATGISAALALADRVLNKDKQACQSYLNFLKSGSSRYPLETLKIAGIDMTTPDPVKQAIGKFRFLVKELEKCF